MGRQVAVAKSERRERLHYVGGISALTFSMLFIIAFLF